MAVVQRTVPAAIVCSQWLTRRWRADSSEFADSSAFWRKCRRRRM